MTHRVLSLAADIVAACDREHPADAELRARLRQDRLLDAGDRRDAARLVFAYFRWLGWLDEGGSLKQQFSQALDFAEKFARHPQGVSVADLRLKSVPAWVRDFADINPEWLRSLQAEPRLWLRARKGRGATLAAQLEDCRTFGDGPLADVLEYTGSRDLFGTPEFNAGEFEIQDITSQAVGFACAPQPGETWWDACAGEGGKLLHLSDLMENRGLIWASDRVAWRLKQLRRRTARARVFNYRAALWDGVKLPTRILFDGVLLDAPCSGLGTWGRNPHARWTLTPLDVRELAGVQQRLLSAMAPSVKPGGKLVYAVCTLTRAETVDVAAAFAQTFPDFEPMPLANPLQPGAPPASPLWLRPDATGGNGMFIAEWRKKKKG